MITIKIGEANQEYKSKMFPDNYEKKRVLITTDIGGNDKDDTQAMIHFLAYTNMFDLEGIVISRPRGDIREMLTVLRAYRRDYRKFLKVSPDYPSPRQLRKLIRVGAERNKKSPPQGFSSPTPGSRLIVRAARKDDPRPLHILSWGSVTDVAQAIANAPDIKKNIKLFSTSGSGFNYRGDPTAYDYIRNMLDFRWITQSGAGAGLYLGGFNNKKYGNVPFVANVVRPRGALGKVFYRLSETIDVNKFGLKMGDSIQWLFIANGDFNRPAKGSWGGRFCKFKKNRYGDCAGENLGFQKNALSVAIHRKKILKDWEQRLKWIYD